MRSIPTSLIASAALSLLAASASAANVYKVHVPIYSLAITSDSSGGGGTKPEPEEPSEPLKLLLQAAQLKEAVAGKAYTMDFSTLLSASGEGSSKIQPGDLKWEIKSGELPSGLSLVGSELTGTPTQATPGSSFEVVATYKDEKGVQTYVLKVGVQLLHVKQFSVGELYTCAVTTTGGVKCWGYNPYGQLGNNSNLDSAVPVDVQGLTSGVAFVSARYNHTCAITTAGGLKCWGFNGNGQLGDNTNINRFSPVDVQGLSAGVSSVSTGGSRTCAITTAGGVKCWGDNAFGQLGNNSELNSPVPVDVEGMASGVSSVSAGDSHTCAVTQSRGLKCWGNNLYGQLGDGSQNNREIPVDVEGLTSGVAAVDAGRIHTCALTSAGQVYCWGNNNAGQLGDNSDTQSTVPVAVHGLSSGISALAAGNNHSCALTTTGRLKCWGANYLGQLGSINLISSPVPVDVPGLATRITSVAVGAGHTCALTAEAGLKCWGYNYYGQLGNNSNANSAEPADVQE